MLKEYTPPKRSAVRFPYNGLGSILLPRTDLVNKIVDEAIRNFEASAGSHTTADYFRGPYGSGKSVLTNLITQELKNRGERVYYFETPEVLVSCTPADFQSFENGIPKGGRVFFIIDEANSSNSSAMWIYLLKKSQKIITIGFGLSKAIGYPYTPQFRKQCKPRYILLEASERTDDVVQRFISISRSSNPSIVPNIDQARAALEELLQYTGGHISYLSIC